MQFLVYAWKIFAFEIDIRLKDKITIFKGQDDLVHVNDGNAETQIMISITPEWIDNHNKTNPTKSFKITIETKLSTTYYIAFKTINEFAFITEEKGFKGDIDSAIAQILNNNILNIPGLVILKNTFPPEYIFKTRAEKEAKAKEVKPKETKHSVVLRQSSSTTTNKTRPNSYAAGEKKEETKTFLQRVDSKQNISNRQRERSNSTKTTTKTKNLDGTSVPRYSQPTRASTSKLSQSTTNLSRNDKRPTRKQSPKQPSKQPSKQLSNHSTNTATCQTRQTKTSKTAAATEPLQTESEKPRGIKGGRKSGDIIKTINEEHTSNEVTEQPVSDINLIEHDKSSQSNYESIFDDQDFEWDDVDGLSAFSTLSIQKPKKDTFTQHRSIEGFNSDDSLDDLDNDQLFSDTSDDTQTPDIFEETTHYTPRVPPMNESTYNLYYSGDIYTSDDEIEEETEKPNLENVTDPSNTGKEPEIIDKSKSGDDQKHRIITDKDGNVIFVLDKTTTYEFQTNKIDTSCEYAEKIKTSENKTQTFIDLIQSITDDEQLIQFFDEIFTNDEIAKDVSDILINNSFIISDAYQRYESFINDAHKHRAYRKYVDKELFLRVLNINYVVYTEVFDEFYSYIKGREDFQNIIEDIKNSDTKTDITNYMTPGEIIEDYDIFQENSCIDKIKKHRENKRITLKELTEDRYKYNFIKHLIIDGYQMDIIKNKQMIENILSVMKNKSIELDDQMFEWINDTKDINTYEVLEKVYDFYLVCSIYEEKVKVMEEFKDQLGTEEEITDFNKYLNQNNIEHHAFESVDLGNNRIFDITAMEEELNKILSEAEEHANEEDLILDFIATHFEKFVRIVKPVKILEEKKDEEEEEKKETTATPQQNLSTDTSQQPQIITPITESDSSENESKNDSTLTKTSVIQENDDITKRKMGKGMLIFMIVSVVVSIIGLIIMVGVLIYRYKKRNALKALEHENNEYDLKELFDDNIDVTFE